MEKLVQSALEEVRIKARSKVPWVMDEPWFQSPYEFTNEAWKVTDYHGGPEPTTEPSITTLGIYSWNIDFMLPFPDSRMSKAIDTLQELIRTDPAHHSMASVVFLQECVESDIELVKSHPWIRDNFILTDIDISGWQSGHYGTITLIDRRLVVESCFRVHYSQTRMERDVLIVDVILDGKKIRACNTHLESLALEPPHRIPQMTLVAQFMRDTEVDGAIVAGDFNAIQDFDRTLHTTVGLKDAYLESGNAEDDDRGHTWGQQAATKLRKQFGTSRMDKVFFCGDVALLSFRNFGSDVMLVDEAERKEIVSLGFDQPWITDHLGVHAVFGPASKASL